MEAWGPGGRCRQRDGRRPRSDGEGRRVPRKRTEETGNCEPSANRVTEDPRVRRHRKTAEQVEGRHVLPGRARARARVNPHR